MSDNWVVQNLMNALNTWNEKLGEIWNLVTLSPQEFKGGTIWTIVTTIHGALQAVGYALLVLFFVVGVVKTCGSFAEIKRPEHAVKLFIRFALIEPKELKCIPQNIYYEVLKDTITAHKKEEYKTNVKNSKNNTVAG